MASTAGTFGTSSAVLAGSVRSGPTPPGPSASGDGASRGMDSTLDDVLEANTVNVPAWLLQSHGSGMAEYVSCVLGGVFRAACCLCAYLPLCAPRVSPSRSSMKTGGTTPAAAETPKRPAQSAAVNDSNVSGSPPPPPPATPDHTITTSHTASAARPPTTAGRSAKHDSAARPEVSVARPHTGSSRLDGQGSMDPEALSWDVSSYAPTPHGDSLAMGTSSQGHHRVHSAFSGDHAAMSGKAGPSQQAHGSGDAEPSARGHNPAESTRVTSQHQQYVCVAFELCCAYAVSVSVQWHVPDTAMPLALALWRPQVRSGHAIIWWPATRFVGPTVIHRLTSRPRLRRPVSAGRRQGARGCA